MLRPQAQIDAPTLQRGLKTLTHEVVFSATCDAMMAGTILTAFALHLGAQPARVGLLATIAFWAQLLQGPGVLLIDRLRTRKRISVTGSLISASAPATMMALAFAAASPAARMGVVGAVAVYCAAGAFAGCAWNAWTRDLIPNAIRGSLLARRSRLAIVTNVSVGLLAALALDRADDPQSRTAVFAGLYVLAFLAQLLSAATLARVPEPAMPPAPEKPRRLVQLLREPLRDARFRPLIHFTTSWQFAVNLAQPFFTVFFLKQLGLGLTLVMGFTIVSQLANVFALKRWGPLADRFGEKSVLNVAAPTFIGCIAAMIGASQIGPLWLVAAYLAVVHAIMGVAAAGVALATGNIALKLSPHGGAAPYLSVNALISSAVGGLAPLLGGLGAEFFAARRVGLVLEWSGPLVRGQVAGIHLTAWDFYFVLSALCGLYALHRLALVREEGELDRREMMQEILARAQARFARPPAAGGAEPPEEMSPDVLQGAPTTPAAAPRPSRGW